MSIADKLTTVAGNVEKVYWSGYTVGDHDGNVNGYTDGYIDGEEYGFGTGWSDNETMVVSALESPVQKVEEYVEESEPVNRDSNAMANYLDENIPKVHDIGVAEGKQAEYDRFWDDFQQNGERENYNYEFGSYGWTDEIFKPKYDICPTESVSYMFSNGCSVKAPMECGVTFDFSNCTTASWFAYASRCRRFGVLDFRKTGSLSYMFDACYSLTKIEKIYFNENNIFSYAFRNCKALTDITVGGTIGQTISFSYSPLTKESITSIINALSTTSSDMKISFLKSAVNNAFETSEGLADGSTSQEWLDLIATKSNWTISLV